MHGLKKNVQPGSQYVSDLLMKVVKIISRLLECKVDALYMEIFISYVTLCFQKHIIEAIYNRKPPDNTLQHSGIIEDNHKKKL
jgi:hypothetical protein